MAESFPDPVVVCIRGASRSGKSTVCEALIAELGGEVRIAWAKRTHHCLDLPNKASGRIWQQQPAAMVMWSPDRLQLTLAPGAPTTAALFAALPPEIDLILLETHEPEPFVTILSETQDAVAGEQVIGRFGLQTAGFAATALADSIRAMLPTNLSLSRMVRVAVSAHEVHVCPESVLGARLLSTGAEALGADLPASGERLSIAVESAGCAATTLRALTAQGSVRVLDYGKLAATFRDQNTGSALRVAVRGEVCRALLGGGDEPAGAIVRQIVALPTDALFTTRPAPFMSVRSRIAGTQPRHTTCSGCGEVVFGGREVMTELGKRCRSCSTGRCVTTRQEREATPWR